MFTKSSDVLIFVCCLIADDTTEISQLTCNHAVVKSSSPQALYCI